MTYDYRLTIKKFVVIFVEVLLAGLVVYATENPTWLVLVPVIEAARNFLKHKVGVRFL